MTTHTTRMLILGSGPAGLSAAIYGARAGMAPIVVQGIQPGGQLTTTTDVENYPGFRDVIQGPWLMQEMQAPAEHVGTRKMWDTIVEVDLPRRPFRLIGDGGDVYKGAVSGGGNTAGEEALYLTNHSPDVTLIHRRDSVRAEKILQQRLHANDKIKVLWNKEVESFIDGGGTAGLVALELRDTVTGELSQLDVEGGFVAIGHHPATELFRGHLELDPDHYIKVEVGATRTSVPGVFACGDVMDKIYRQAVTAAGTGCMAALDAEKYLAAQEFEVLAAE